MVLFGASYASRLAPTFLRHCPEAQSALILDALSNGRSDRFKAAAERAVHWNLAEVLSMGMSHSVTCHDAAYPYLADYLSYRQRTSVCHKWPVGVAAASEAG